MSTGRHLLKSIPVVLVSMPWAPATEPALGLGILRQCLRSKGYETRVLHAGPQLLRWISIETYAYIADCWGLNEFTFSKELDGDLDQTQTDCLLQRVALYASAARHPHYKSSEALCDLFLTMRDRVIPEFLQACAEQILSWQPALVGFTCMFDQTIASVALAKILKREQPNVKVVFGGYALEGPAGDEVARAFPWVDRLVRGDGEAAIVDLAKWALESEELPVSVGNRVLSYRPIDLNTSPTPNYDDWFSDLTTLSSQHQIAINNTVLPVESSRGCWWGQTMHCVFCGIDELTLKYRMKEPDVALSMLQDLRTRYGDGASFRFSDYILPKRYYTDVLPALSQVVPRFTLVGEIKANQTPERMKLFADAGFIELQPGIESFSTPVLKAMDKGVRGIDNVATLKYGYINRIQINYNILYGLPGDCLDDYYKMVELIPRLYHLIPPISRTETIITRFAPLQATPGRFGIDKAATHHECYDALFSTEFLQSTAFNLDNYCYYFNRHFEYGEGLADVYAMIVCQVNHWKFLHRERDVALSVSACENGSLSICDTRFSEEGVKYALARVPSIVYLECDAAPVRRTELVARLASGSDIDELQINRALSELDEQRLIWREDDYVFGLAIASEITAERVASGWTRNWSTNYL